MNSIRLKVTGMSCGHCEQAVRREIAAVEPVPGEPVRTPLVPAVQNAADAAVAAGATAILTDPAGETGMTPRGPPRPPEASCTPRPDGGRIDLMSEALPEGYPRLAEADVVLRDGTVARLRPILPSDAEGLVDWSVSVDSTITRAHQHATNTSRPEQDTGGWVELQESAAGRV